MTHYVLPALEFDYDALEPNIYDHQSNLMQSGIPILVVDAWEHVYYLHYENRKAEFIEALWSVWNWADIATRYEAAASTQPGLEDVAN